MYKGVFKASGTLSLRCHQAVVAPSTYHTDNATRLYACLQRSLLYHANKASLSCKEAFPVSRRSLVCTPEKARNRHDIHISVDNTHKTLLHKSFFLTGTVYKWVNKGSYPHIPVCPVSPSASALRLPTGSITPQAMHVVCHKTNADNNDRQDTGAAQRSYPHILLVTC